jgi:phosphoribosylglycinamide formyltransferase-1
MKVAFLCSGGGGNLKLVYELSRKGALPFVSVVGVIADRECLAVEWARGQDIRTAVVAYSRTNPVALGDSLTDLAPDLIVTNIHKILHDRLVAMFDGKLLNLHYSLLPAFAGQIGMQPVREARARGCRLIGASAHRVTRQVDTGPILAQACVVDDLDQPETELCDAVFRCGGVALIAAIETIWSPATQRPGGDMQAGARAIVAAPLPTAAVRSVFREHSFWVSLR